MRDGSTGVNSRGGGGAGRGVCADAGVLIVFIEQRPEEGRSVSGHALKGRRMQPGCVHRSPAM